MCHVDLKHNWLCTHTYTDVIFAVLCGQICMSELFVIWQAFGIEMIY